MRPAGGKALLSPRELALVQGLLDMYRQGWFPMLDPGGDSAPPEVQWVQPHQRGIIPLDAFLAPRSLRQRVRSRRFHVTSDTAFDRVIHACAAPAKGREDTWLDPSIIEAFELLHKAGHAHSVEAWLSPPDQPPVLVGGLYGLALGAVFCGESMFSRPDLGGTDASKVCLFHLVEHLRLRGFALLDAQMVNEHLSQFGCHEMPRERYLALLARHVDEPRDWSPFGDYSV